MFEPTLLEVLDFHNLKYVQLVLKFQNIPTQNALHHHRILLNPVMKKGNMRKISRLESPTRMEVEILPLNMSILKNTYCTKHRLIEWQTESMS